LPAEDRKTSSEHAKTAEGFCIGLSDVEDYSSGHLNVLHTQYCSV